jgi:hypothetical protein
VVPFLFGGTTQAILAILLRMWLAIAISLGIFALVIGEFVHEATHWIFAKGALNRFYTPSDLYVLLGVLIGALGLLVYWLTMPRRERCWRWS